MLVIIVILIKILIMKKKKEEKKEEKKEKKKKERKEKGIDLLKKIMSNPSSIKTTYIKDLSDVGILNPNKEFELFSKKIYLI